MDILERLLGHDAWTTGRLIEQSRFLSAAQLEQPFDLGHGTVLATLEHIVGNLETWVDLMRGRPIRVLPPPLEPWHRLDGLQTRQETAAGELSELALQMQLEGRLDELWTDFLDAPPTQKTFGGAIVHVITHAMHHRAQLIHMLKRLGVPDVVEGDALGWEKQFRQAQR